MLVSFLKSLAASEARAESVAPARAAIVFPELTFARGGKVIAFVSGSQGDALRQHTLEMLRPLRPHCTGVAVIDIRDPGWHEQLAAAAQEPVWFAMAPFGGGEVFRAASGEVASPWAEAGIPFVRLFGDTPAYFPSKHFQHFRNSINAYGHAEHWEFYLKWFNAGAPSLWQPLFPLDARPREAVDVDRKLAGSRIVFVKNGNCPDRLVDYWRTQLPPEVARALEAVAEEACGRLDEPYDFAVGVQAWFSRLGIDLGRNRRLLFFMVAQLDDYTRRRKSTLIARSLLDLPVVVRGIHWDHVDFSGRRATHDADSDYTRTRDLFDSSLAIVDMSANTHRGAHDRALRAAGRYTTCFTNLTRFFGESFPDAASFTYRFDEDSIAALVGSALERPLETVEIGFAQAERMRKLLTEERYVEQLVAAIDACALGCGGRPTSTQDFVIYEPLA